MIKIEDTKKQDIEDIEKDKPEDVNKDEDLVTRGETAAKDIKESLKEHRELTIRQEKAAMLNQLGGKSEAGSIPDKPKKLTDEEYADALDRGEVNPLKEDGFI